MNRFLRADLALLASVFLSMLAVQAVGGGRLPGAQPLAGYRMRPTVTATPNWWDEVVTTPYPLRPLPPIPKPGLDRNSPDSAAAAVAFDVVACPSPGVRITAMARRGVWWENAGTAAIPHLWYWKAELSPDGSHWVQLHRSEAAVDQGLLMQFHTGTVPPGAYQLRLTVVDRTGNYPEPCVVRVVTGSR